MKRLVLLLAFTTLSAVAFSQTSNDGKFRLGAGAVYTSEIENTGFNIKGVFEITDKWELAAGYTHIFKNLGLGWDVIDMDAHYVFYNNDKKLTIYALSGLAFTYWERDAVLFPGEVITGTYVGMNLGFGTNIALSESISLVPEIRGTVFDLEYSRLGLMVQYMF